MQVATFSLLALEAVPLEGCTIKLEVDKEMPQDEMRLLSVFLC